MTVRVNGADVAVTADPRTSLLEVLREDCGMTGTKDGCSEGECGACTVLLDGRARCACLTPVGVAVGGVTTTIEGLRDDPVGEQLVDAFAREGAVQCGFCSPGFVVAAWAGLACGGRPDPADVLRGNLCRCTGYVPIIAAVRDVAAREQPASPIAVTDGRIPRSSRDPRFVVPATLAEACSAVGDHAMIVGGGTALMAGNHLRDVPAVWIGGLPELRTVERRSGRIRIGAAVTWTQLRHDPTITRLLPALAAAAASIGGRQIQNAGTFGGNLASAAPGADGVPPLLLHDAEVELTSAVGVRRVLLADLVTAAGETLLADDEILTAVVVAEPATPRTEFFVKVGPRKGRAVIDKVTVACSAVRNGTGLADVRIAIGAAAPSAVRATAAEQVLLEGPPTVDRIVAAATAAADPLGEDGSASPYLRRLVRGVLIRELTARLR